MLSSLAYLRVTVQFIMQRWTNGADLMLLTLAAGSSGMFCIVVDLTQKSTLWLIWKISCIWENDFGRTFLFLLNIVKWIIQAAYITPKLQRWITFIIIHVLISIVIYMQPQITGNQLCKLPFVQIAFLPLSLLFFECTGMTFRIILVATSCPDRLPW